jgi:hypothetical protein
MSKDFRENLTPQELKRLQTKSGLSNAELADWLMISVKRLMNAKSENSLSPLSAQQFQLLLLVADEHPVYTLLKKRIEV